MHSPRIRIRLEPLLWLAAGLLTFGLGVAGCGSDEEPAAPPPAAEAAPSSEAPGTAPPPPATQQSAGETRRSKPPTAASEEPTDSEDYQDAEELDEAVRALRSPDPDERSDAVLDIEPEGRGLSYLLEVLSDDPDPEVRVTAIGQLGDSESPEAVAGLVSALHDSDPEVVLEAIDALEYIDDPSVIGSLEKLLQHPDEEVREAAEDAIDYLE